jgi:hypothetical protein
MLLKAQGIIDDLLEDPGDQMGIEAVPAACGNKLGEKFLLASDVTEGKAFFFFETGNPVRNVPALGQGLENPLVKGVNL